MEDFNKFAGSIVDKAIKAGATSAEAYINDGNELDIEISMGKIQKLLRSGSKGVGLRIFKNGRRAFVSSSDLSEKAVNSLVHKAVIFADEATPEEYNTLPPEYTKAPVEDLELIDNSIESIPLDRKISIAKEMEQAAFDFDKRITKTRASSYGDSRYTTYLTNSDGLAVSYTSTSCYLGISVTAEDKGHKQSNGYGVGKRFFADLPENKWIAEEASKGALMTIGGDKVKTQKVPVVFDRTLSTILLGAIAGGINGERVFRDQSFLKGKLNEKIASDLVTVIDDGRMKRGARSRPFDGEGVLTNSKPVVENGILKTYLYNTYSANKAGTKSTGNASRGSYTGTPGIGPLNFYMQKGNTSKENIIKSVKNGLLILDFVGGGPNTLTGDFSAGIAGVWIKNGKLGQPVAKVTVAGKLLDMLTGIEAVGDDLLFEGGTNCPTIKIKEMTVSGT